MFGLKAQSQPFLLSGILLGLSSILISVAEITKSKYILSFGTGRDILTRKNDGGIGGQCEVAMTFRFHLY